MNIPRTRFGDIVAEFLPPRRIRKKTTKNDVLIICGGMPGSAPSKPRLLEFFSRKGYWVISPRYRGTWESGGEFLKYPPETDIGIIISRITKHGITDLQNHKRHAIRSPRFYVLGISFGGPAAILSLRDRRITKAVAVAPVVDWRIDSKMEPLTELYEYLRAGFPGAYRMKAARWRELAGGRFYNPATEAQGIEGRRLLVIHAKDDKIVPFAPTAQFAKRVGAKLIVHRRGGHLSSRILMHKKTYDTVKKFFRRP